MADAIGRLGDIDRPACRRAAERRFTVERMVEAMYEMASADPIDDLGRRCAAR